MTAKAIMVQGTMSGVGKSLLVAALCRIFAQDGYRVAPFKSQNMALNSFITNAGEEMGRAQVVQAQAAGIPPESAMNPILLKPTNDVGSQVIVNGRVRGNMTAREYFAYKRQLVPTIRRAYDSLARRFDLIVIEGAGSPAEVNLKNDDIVNMGMAKMAAAPVLLVGDIDRGGVFAQLIGTMMLLDPDERRYVKALVVNKFRGDVSILDPGLDILRERTGLPVAGVVPYTTVDIDDEDSLSNRFDGAGRAAAVDIAVVRLPRLSNFTDFMALSALDGVRVRYVSSPRELASPDLVVLPGTKSTLDDLKWLRESGMEAAVLKQAAAGIPVFGICGGFQMLGLDLADPQGVEGGGSMRGLGLLPIRTVFAGEKRQERVTRTLEAVGGALSRLSGVEVEGYEIHMGRTVLDERSEPDCPVAGAGGPSAVPQRLKCPVGISQSEDCLSIGPPVPGTDRFFPAPLPQPRSSTCQEEGPALFQRGNVYGTYIHGFFDRQECAQAVVSALLEAKGLDALAVRALDMAAYREQQYDKLACAVREALDMNLVYRILGEGV